jgi:hypothetical protein
MGTEMKFVMLVTGSSHKDQMQASTSAIVVTWGGYISPTFDSELPRRKLYSNLILQSYAFPSAFQGQ